MLVLSPDSSRMGGNDRPARIIIMITFEGGLGLDQAGPSVGVLQASYCLLKHAQRRIAVQLKGAFAGEQRVLVAWET